MNVSTGVARCAGGAAEGRERGLRRHRHVRGELAERDEDAGVGGGVAKARQGVLNDGEGDTAIEAGPPSLYRVEIALPREPPLAYW